MTFDMYILKDEMAKLLITILLFDRKLSISVILTAILFSEY